MSDTSELRIANRESRITNESPAAGQLAFPEPLNDALRATGEMVSIRAEMAVA
jgi:hypothetical protein